MKKKNYTGLVTEYVSLKPIYNLMDIVITGSQDDASGAFVEEDDPAPPSSLARRRGFSMAWSTGRTVFP